MRADAHFALAGPALALLVALLWAPFGLHVGPDTDTWNIQANPEQYPWLTPSPLRPFQFVPQRLAALLTPRSFVGRNLLLALSVVAKGWLMYLLLARVQPGRPAFAFLAAALLMLYPVGIFNFRASMVAYQNTVAWYLAAALLLVGYAEQPGWGRFLAMQAALLAALGQYETLLPLVVLTPLVLVWRERGAVAGLPRIWASWLVLPAGLAGYVAYALVARAGAASYQSSRVDLASGNLLRELLGSLRHVYGQHFAAGFAGGLGELGRAPLAQRTLAVAAGLLVAAVAFVLARRGDAQARPESPRHWLLLAAAAGAAVWIGYAFYFPTDLRYHTYRVFFFSALGASVAVAALLQLVAGARPALFAAGAGLLAACAMAYSLGVFRSWDEHARREEALLVRIVRALPAVRSGTLVAVMETKGALFDYQYYVWFYQNALRLVYGDRQVHAVLCFRNVREDDQERPACEARADGLHIRNAIAMDSSSFPWERTIVLLQGRDRSLSVAESVPGLAETPPAYDPRALYSASAPPPPALLAYAPHAGELGQP